MDLRFCRRRLMCPNAVSIEWGLFAAIIEGVKRGRLPSHPLLAALSKVESHGLKEHPGHIGYKDCIWFMAYEQITVR